MSWLSTWWKGRLERGFFFRWNKDWPGEKDLPHFNWWHKTDTKEDVENEIRDSLKKKKTGGK